MSDTIKTGEQIQIFDGIDLIFENEKNASFIADKGNILEIRHCKSGRAEFPTGDGFFYLDPGDMYVGAPPDSPPYFPSGEYFGIAIRADISKTPKCLSCILQDVNVNPDKLLDKFSKGLVTRSDERTAHIFSEIYNADESVKMGYFKIKILELFLFLSHTDISESETVSHSVSKSQIELTCKINAYINSHSDEHLTLTDLAGVFNTSPTGIKNAYKSVFSTSFSSYVRSLKMNKAAALIEKTDMSILDVALSVGYTNPSKFAKAFYDKFGVNPKKYSLRDCRKA